MMEANKKEQRLIYFQNAVNSLQMIMEHDFFQNWSMELKTAFEETCHYFSTRTEPFQLAVCGLFQAGKSTTVNAMLEGREMSASSAVEGIRTSACNVYFSYGEKEQYSVQWFRQEEICKKIAESLQIEVDSEKLVKEETEKLLWNIFLKQWNTHKQDKNLDKIEKLKRAGLLLAGLEGLPFLYYTKQNRRHLEEVLQIGKAPDDETIRWNRIRRAAYSNAAELKEHIQKEFPMEEVVYPFIHSIKVQVNSKWLKDKNLCIVDTPGFDVNKQDTETALRAVKTADVLVYIFTGEKEPDESERQFMYQLKQEAPHCPVLFLVNWYGKQKETILNSIQTLLQQSGYEDAPLVSYRALMAYRAVQGLQLFQYQSEQSIEKQLLVQAEENGFCTDSPREAWKLLTAEELHLLFKEDAKRVEELGICAENIERVKYFSNWKEVNQKLTEVIRELSRRIFVENRINMLCEKVEEEKKRWKQQMEQELKVLERKRDAQIDVWKQQEHYLEVFCERKKKEFQLQIDETWTYRTAEQIWKVFEAKRDKIASSLTDYILSGDKELAFAICSGDWNQLWDYLQKETTYPAVILNPIHNTAYLVWKKEFLSSSGTTSSKLFYASKKFEKVTNENEFINYVWTTSIGRQGLLDIQVSTMLNQKWFPINNTDMMRKTYSDSLLDGYVIGESHVVEACQTYYAVKHSWNPFINKEVRMKKAKQELCEALTQALSARFSKIRSSAIKAYASLEDGLPYSLFLFANKWCSSVIAGAESLAEDIIYLEVKKMEQEYEEQRKYIENRFQLQWEYLKSVQCILLRQK